MQPRPGNRGLIYCRVSRGDKQSSEAQRHALEQLCAARGLDVVSVHEEAVTGDPRRRRGTPPALEAALLALDRREADVLVIFAVDRLARGISELFRLLERVQDAGAHVICATGERRLDTTTAIGKLLIALYGYVAEWELEIRRSRTKAGMDAKRAQGKHIGRPRVELPDEARVVELLGLELSERAIARRLRVPRSRIERVKAGWLKRLRENPGAGSLDQQGGVDHG